MIALLLRQIRLVFLHQVGAAQTLQGRPDIVGRFLVERVIVPTPSVDTRQIPREDGRRRDIGQRVVGQRQVFAYHFVFIDFIGSIGLTDSIRRVRFDKCRSASFRRWLRGNGGNFRDRQ